MIKKPISKFQVVPHRRLTEEIADQIERLILNNELSVGDALPPERELAAQLKVSRNILREAVSTLTQKGLLEVRPGSGTYVVQPTFEFLRDTLDFLIRFNTSALIELAEARRSIEVEIAGLAAERAKPEDIERIMTHLKEMEEASYQPEAYVEADIRFHAALAQAASNQILQLLLDSIRGTMREAIHLLVKNHPTAWQEAMKYHRQIADAIQQHAPAAARLAMRNHLDSVRTALQELEESRAAADSEKGAEPAISS